MDIRAGHHCAQPLHDHLGIHSTARASLMFYNTKEEIDRFLESVSNIRRRMGFGNE
jgi:cysteine desulfurase/selenocysteine lyase